MLTGEQWACWEENGYVIIPQAVPDSHLEAVIGAISDFLELDPDDPATWYNGPPRRLGFVEMYHHQAMWDNRQYPRVYEAYKSLWKEEKLWVSIDRNNMTPPEREDRAHGFNESLIHWDIDTSDQPGLFKVQGVLYLTDTAENQGGFQCVPGFHRDFFEWVETQPADRDPMRPDLTGLKPVTIPGRAGDLLIWHSLLPHGNSRNTFRPAPLVPVHFRQPEPGGGRGHAPTPRLALERPCASGRDFRAIRAAWNACTVRHA